MRKNPLLNFTIGIIGSVICLIGDNLLGCFDATGYFSKSLIFPKFSVEWSIAPLWRFVIGGVCGVISLPLIFFGFYAIYEIMQERKTGQEKAYLLGAVLFCSFGILYHCIFAMAGYEYSFLMKSGFYGAAEASWNLFITFIPLAFGAVIGFIMLSLSLFKIVWKKAIGFPIWAAFCNVIIIMLFSMTFSLILPQTALVTGVLGWGQQSIGLLIMFSVYRRIYKKQITV